MTLSVLLEWGCYLHFFGAKAHPAGVTNLKTGQENEMVCRAT